MKRRIKAIILGAAIIGAAITGIGIASGSGSDDDDEVDVPITGIELDKASEAALGHMGGGVVTETEVGDQESFYEVEVTLDDGSQVDVQLDENFNVVASEPDDDGPDDDEAEPLGVGQRGPVTTNLDPRHAALIVRPGGGR